MDPVLGLILLGVGAIAAGSVGAVALFNAQRQGKDAQDLRWRSAGFAPDPRTDGYIGPYKGWTLRIGPDTMVVLAERKIATVCAVSLPFTGIQIPAAAGEIVRTGDAPFDARYTCSGGHLQLAARLTPQVRAAFAGMRERAVAIGIQDGELRRTRPGVVREFAEIELAYAALAPILDVLPKEDPITLAMRTATADPSPQMRYVALLGLAEAKVPEAAAIGIAARTARDPTERRGAHLLLAALGQDVSDTIEPTDKTEAGWRALVAMLRTLGATATMDGLFRRLRGSADPDAQALGLRLSQGRIDAETRADAIRLMASEDPAVVGAAVLVVRGMAAPEAEAPMIAALGRRIEVDTVVHWLGKNGSVAAVVPLATYADAFGVVGAADKAARDAILLIQARQVGASAGQVALSGLDGAVDLATQAGTLDVVSGDEPPARPVG